MDIATTGTKTETSAPAKADADRLALAEVQCRLGDVGRELAAMRDGTVFPAMAADRRAEQIRQLEADLARLQARHAELSRAVPERTRSPARTARRRRSAGNGIGSCTCSSALNAEPTCRPSLAYLTVVAGDRAAPREVRRKARDARQRTEVDLQVLDAEPSDQVLSAQQMCPDALHLAARHGYIHTSRQPAWPCPSWPGQQRIWREVGLLLDRTAATRAPHELTCWELTLHCGHVVHRTAHRSYATYAAAGGVDRPCESCGVGPSFVVQEQSQGPAGPAPATPAATAHPPPTAAQRERMSKRAERLEAELVDLRRRLQDDAPRSDLE